MGYRIAADIGGTFTDFVFYDDEAGNFGSFKLPSTPPDPAEAILDGIKRISGNYKLEPEKLDYFVHGNTIGLNAILQGRGARVGLITSEGFGDVLELARLRLPDVLALTPRKPQTLVRRRFVKEVPVTIRANGTVEASLDTAAAEQVVEQLSLAGVDSWAVSLKNGYLDGEIEDQLRELILSTLSAKFVSTSSEIWPQIREYERTMVTVLNAYVQPIVDRYLGRLEKTLHELGFHAPVYLTRSNGGLMSFEDARHQPVNTLLSGPASGAMGASYIAQQTGAQRCIGVDMGGTSTDVCLIQDGVAKYSTESMIGEFPMIMPSVDISSIGTGGSSVAWIDDLGILKVGPESAGSDPGPACYGRGGRRATTTDAYLVAGFLGTENFAGGQMLLDRSLAKEAVSKLSKRLEFSVEETAWSILQVATANMATELQLLLAKQGLDQRDFAILAYGGAGPTHAALLAQEVGIDHIVVPPNPGTLCALGALITDVKHDLIQVFFQAIDDLNPEDLEQSLDGLLDEAKRRLHEEELAQELSYRISMEMRYEGEPYDLEVVLPEQMEWSSPDTVLVQIRQSFHEVHRRTYNFSDESARILIQNLRVRVEGKVSKPNPPEAPGASSPIENLVKTTRHIFLGQWEEAAVYNRADLGTGHYLEGPCIVEQADTTTIVPPTFVGEVDQVGNLLIRKKSV